MKILSVVGARPNFMKIAPIVHELRRRGLPHSLVHTGQHYDAALSGDFFRDLDIPPPEISLGVGSGSHAEQTAKVMLALEPYLLAERPDLVLVVGDVNSTLAAALTAAKLGIPTAHVEAGLRSFDRAMPEELNRLATDALADLLFVSEPSGVENLRREGVATERIHLVGNVMIDTLLAHLSRARALDVPARFGLVPGGYALVTLHRPSNVEDAVVFAGLLDALEQVALRVPVLFPVHPRTRRRVEALGAGRRFGEPAGRLPPGATGLWWLPPAGYLDFLSLQAGAALVLTDSGGIQEETTALGVPCLTLRTSTERPITVAEGTNTIVGVSPARIVAESAAVLDGRRKPGRVPALWDGHAAERIVAVLAR